MKNILLPTDFSDISLNSINYRTKTHLLLSIIGTCCSFIPHYYLEQKIYMSKAQSWLKKILEIEFFESLRFIIPVNDKLDIEIVEEDYGMITTL